MGRPIGVSPFPSLRLRRGGRWCPLRRAYSRLGAGGRCPRRRPALVPSPPRSAAETASGHPSARRRVNASRTHSVAAAGSGCRAALGAFLLLPRSISRPPIPPPWCCFFWGQPTTLNPPACVSAFRLLPCRGLVNHEDAVSLTSNGNTSEKATPPKTTPPPSRRHSHWTFCRLIAFS